MECSVSELVKRGHEQAAELKNDEVRQRLANAEHQLHMAELEAALGELKKISEQPAVSTHYARVLRRHIAELEARTVTLPAQRFCPGEYVGSVLWAETEIWNKAISACDFAVRAAGIKVKGE